MSSSDLISILDSVTNYKINEITYDEEIEDDTYGYLYTHTIAISGASSAKFIHANDGYGNGFSFFVAPNKFASVWVGSSGSNPKGSFKSTTNVGSLISSSSDEYHVIFDDGSVYFAMCLTSSYVGIKTTGFLDLNDIELWY